MITVFVTKEGYYVAGDGIEATLKCTPATDERGNPIFHELHHTYKVMFLALKEIATKKNIQSDVIVYNDSRIIDELNGDIQPLDDTCSRWQNIIRRELIPYIRSIVFFRKKATEYIRTQVRLGESLLTKNDLSVVGEYIEKLEKEKAHGFKANAIDRFRKMWKNE